MNEISVFLRANECLLEVIKQIRDDQWNTMVPPEMSWTPNQTLRDITNYHTYDDAWVPDVLAGKTKAEVAEAYESLLTTSDTITQYKKYNTRANQAVTQFNEPQKIVHLSYGDFTAQQYLQHITLFRGFRVHDIAILIEVPPVMPDDLVQGLWDITAPQAEALRDMHVFGPEVVVPEDAPLRDRLLGLSGRQP